MVGITMLLTGTFARSLDEKTRFAIPKRLRDALGFPDPSPLFLAPGLDGSLDVYPAEVFYQLGDRLGEGSPTAQGVRAFSRLFYAQAQQVEADRQGRIRIPSELAELAGLSKEIILVGVRDHLEIWDKHRWEEYLAKTQPQYDQIAEHAFGLPVSDAVDQPTRTEAHPTQPR